MANVFISYARRDRERVAQLTSALEGEGLSVWWDSELLPGRRFRQIIAEELAMADSVIVVWTAAALESDWVQDEAEEGRQRGVLIPVVFEPVRPPAGFRQVQAADLSQWTGSNQHPEFRSLVFAVRSLVQIARATAKAAPPPPGGLLALAPEVETAEAIETAPTALAEPEPARPPFVAPTAAPSRAEAAPRPQTAGPARSWTPRLGWSWWLGAAVSMALCVAFIRSPFSYPYCAAPLAACLLAAVSGRTDLGEAVRTRVALVCAIGGALAALLAAYLLRHRPSEAVPYALFFFGPLAASAAFIVATSAMLAARRLAGPVAISTGRPTADAAPRTAAPTALGRMAGLVFAWPWWLAAAVAMGLCVAVINASNDGDAIEPYFFCAAPLLASLSAALGRRAGLGQVARAAIVWVALGVGAAILPLVALLSLELSAEWKAAASLAMGLYFAIGAMSAIFVFGTGGTLLARLLRRPRASSGSLR